MFASGMSPSLKSTTTDIYFISRTWQVAHPNITNTKSKLVTSEDFWHSKNMIIILFLGLLPNGLVFYQIFSSGIGYLNWFWQFCLCVMVYLLPQTFMKYLFFSSRSFVYRNTDENHFRNASGVLNYISICVLLLYHKHNLRELNIEQNEKMGIHHADVTNVW